MSENPDVVVVGSFNQDLSFSTARFPAPGETRLGRFATGPGGKGFNQAIATHRLGVATGFIGAVGFDVFAEGVKAFARAEGLACAFAELPDQPTGAASIVVDDAGENQIIVALGANDHLSAAHVEAQRNWLEAAKVVVTQAECRLAATEAALAQGRRAGAVTVFNPAPINEAVGPELVAAADILTPNETEFAFLMRHLFDEALPEAFWDAGPDALHALCRRIGADTVVITLGAQGCFVSHADERASEGAKARIGTPGKVAYFVPAIEVTAVDTSGAGDAFTGGLAAGLIRHPGDFPAAVRYAVAASGLSVTRPGTAPAMPTAAEVAPLSRPT